MEPPPLPASRGKRGRATAQREPPPLPIAGVLGKRQPEPSAPAVEELEHALSEPETVDGTAAIVLEHLPPSSCLCFTSQPRKRPSVKATVGGRDEKTIPQGASASWAVQPGTHVINGTIAGLEGFFGRLGGDRDAFESHAVLSAGQTATFEIGWEQRGSSRWYTYIAAPNIT